MTYPAGSLVTVKFAGEVKGVLTTDDLAAQVSQAIQYAGYTVRSTQVTTPTFWNLIELQWVHYAYTGTIVFSAGWELDDDELTNVLTNAVLSVTGLSPTGIAISGGATPTDATPGGAPAPSIAGMASDFFSGLTKVGLGLLALVALVVALLVFRPDIGRLAIA